MTLLSSFLIFLVGFSLSDVSPRNTNPNDLYKISIASIEGKSIDLNTYKGKKILFVNVASKCGYTKQYTALQKLYEKHSDELVIIGLPCNQFGSQEPGTAEEIVQFCERNYGVTFPITEKIEVKGDGQHPLYQWLTQKRKNGQQDSSVKWNFQKYLVDESGMLIGVFGSEVTPMDDQILDKLN